MHDGDGCLDQPGHTGQGVGRAADGDDEIVTAHLGAVDSHAAHGGPKVSCDHLCSRETAGSAVEAHRLRLTAIGTNSEKDHKNLHCTA